MLWRLKQFLTLWGRLLTAGESYWGKARRVIGMLFVLGALPYALRDYSLLIYLQPTGAYRQVPLGLLLAAIFAAAWALLTAGRAYELAGVADLQVATELEEDRGSFRLRLLSKHKDLETTVRLLAVLDTAGNPYLINNFPIELEWRPQESRVHFTAEFVERVTVARFDGWGVGIATMRFAGVRDNSQIKLGTNESVHFFLSVEHAKRKPIERCFKFHHVGNGVFNTSLVTSPPVTLQAILLETKRET